ncbi:prospero homeobox protein 2 isoform X2 [Dromiciops gliroides]|uniref:prospero homeobox protein 2 isoform X2 n=1 Tax=Dromiciops gliroides TaxID=33562 RepID=UPI001CC4EE16|nr:prospero homeobox protein 2 isoform X2 [Dromiciops gliroides]
MDPNILFLSSKSQTYSHMGESMKEEGRSPSSRGCGQDSPISWDQITISNFVDSDWFCDEHIQAKRARVETIIQGMSLSPNPLAPLSNSREKDSKPPTEKSRENKRKQKLPQQQNPQGGEWSGASTGNCKGEGHHFKEQLQMLQQQLRHLQERLFQLSEHNILAQSQKDTERNKDSLKHKNEANYGHWAVGIDQYKDLKRNFTKGEKPNTFEEESQSRAPWLITYEEKTLSEILKKELTGAVSQVVDSVLRKVLSKPSGHQTELVNGIQMLGQDRKNGYSTTTTTGNTRKDQLSLEDFQNMAQSQAEVQPSALPLSMRKCSDSLGHPVNSGMSQKPYQSPPVNLTMTSHMQENQILSQLLGYGQNGQWSYSPSQISSSQDTSSLPSLDLPWGTIKRQSSGMSQQQYPLPFTSSQAESLALLPTVKMEHGNLKTDTDAAPFASVHIQEGLNPGHLKKAKLMFFFTRYPSSSLLKAYFPDVQMEKFARQAISDGITNPNMLKVPRNSELFRTLNLHYNKGNDFEVPDQFLEIASLTLQEFFNAVTAGKDSDPSWKKPIYKIISKLDSDIPEIFKSSSCPQELLRN